MLSSAVWYWVGPKKMFSTSFPPDFQQDPETQEEVQRMMQDPKFQAEVSLPLTQSALQIGPFVFVVLIENFLVQRQY